MVYNLALAVNFCKILQKKSPMGLLCVLYLSFTYPPIGWLSSPGKLLAEMMSFAVFSKYIMSVSKKKRGEKSLNISKEVKLHKLPNY